MKVNVKNAARGYLFEDIKAGDVFYSVVDPNMFLLRTDSDSWVAVDIESGELYHRDYFNHNVAQYHITNTEVAIS